MLFMPKWKAIEMRKRLLEKHVERSRKMSMELREKLANSEEIDLKEDL